MKLIIEKSVIVITPTIGSSKLADAIISIQNQTYKNVKHLLVVDGKEHYLSTMNALPVSFETTEFDVITLPYNTGANGFNGQRIYASIPHLVNADYIFFLDEDNWYEPNHVRTLVETIEQQNLDWAFSLRKIFSPDKQYLADDNCESLGKWPIFFTHDNPQYLVDTSAFAFKREFIKATCHLWHSGAWGEDRRYLYSVANKSKWNTSGNHTLCYRVDGNPKSVNGDFFIEGNKQQLNYYKGQLPWLKI
jgi:glycosyltransferase involved in cell wall biosynthesis